MADIAAFHTGNNAALIAKCATLGYLRPEDHVLDLTYGLGGWWKLWQPTAGVVSNDLYVDAAQYHADFTNPPAWMVNYDVVTLDPPYRLRGTPDSTFDTRYGTQYKATEVDILSLLTMGAQIAVRCARPGGIVLIKCQDQVCSGRVVWQTHYVIDALKGHATLVDRFDMPPSRPQPLGRRQLHARRGSTLLVFKKGK
jgi:hypothetical protein